jgi:ribonuclease-3
MAEEMASKKRGSKAEEREEDRIKYENSLVQFQERIGYKFIRPEYLREALRHSSFVADVNSSSKYMDSNERLEFLGDSVIELVIRDKLFQERQKDDQGRLTLTRAWLASKKNLANAAKRIHIDAVLRLGRSLTGKGPSESMMADAFEALTGAVFLDGGPIAAFSFVRWNLFEHGAISEAPEGFNAKTILKERCDAIGKTPKYKCDPSRSGQSPRFECEVRALGIVGKGEGGSIAEAQERAALVVLEKLQREV